MRYFGIAKEATFGTPVTTDGSFTYFDIGKCGIDPPDDPNIKLDTIEETPSRQKKGFYSPGGSVELATDIDTMLKLLYLAMGGYVFTSGGTGTGVKHTHEIYVDSNRTLPSSTIRIGKDNGGNHDYEYQTYGNVISKIGVEISDGIAKTSFDVVAKKDGKASLQSSVSIGTNYPMAFYEARAYNNSVDVSAPTKSVSLELDNAISATDGQGLGSMFPYKLRSNGKTWTLKSTLEFQGYDYLQKFWGDDAGPVCTTEYFPYKIDFEDEQENTLQFLFPKCAYKSVAQPVEGSDLIKQDIELNVFKGPVTLNDDETTVYTSCLATIENGASSLTS